MAHTVHQESEAYETLSGATAEAAPPPLVAGPAPRPLRLSAVFARIGGSPAMVKGAVWSMGGYGAGAVASFVVQVILARALEATRYGVYSYLLAWVNVAVLAGKLEFDTVAIRFIATYDGQRQDGLLRGFWQYGWRVVSRTTTGIALLAGGAAWLLRRQLHPGIEGGIWAACVLVPLTALLAFSGCTLQGFRRVPQSHLSQQSDILVVGTVLSARDAGLYSVASQLTGLVGLGAAAVIFVALPAVADLHARARRAEFQHLVVRTVQACAAVSVPVVVLLFVAGRMILRVYGPAFVDAYPILLLLSVGGLMGWTIGLPGSLLPATGHEWQASRVIVATALLNLALTFVLTPTFGIVGAATATVVAQLVRVGVLRWYAWRYLGVTTLLWLPAERRVREGA